MNESCVVEMKAITKQFPGVLANDRVDLTLRRGEVHALLGENGAGKTTLMNILSGLYQPDQGEILICGSPVQLNSPSDAIAHGIGMVHQHFMLARVFTVAENIVAGLDRQRFWIQEKKIHAEIKKFSQDHRLEINPRAKVWQLSVGEQQRVEILRSLYRQADVLILDEPTSVLTVQEAEELFVAIRRMTEQGKAIIFISHKLDEVFAIADRITVLRGGKVVGTMETATSNKRELAHLMVGREMDFTIQKEKHDPGETILSMEGVHALSDFGTTALRDFSLEVRRREIVGIAGVSGNGQRELAEVITGQRPCTRGKITVEHGNQSNPSTRWMIDELNIGHIPEDRMHTATVQKLSLVKNVALNNYRKPFFSKKLFIDWKYVSARTSELIERFQVKTPGPQVLAGKLSGGNLQKLILARETSGSPPLLVVVHPTYGLDVAATKFIHETLLDQCKAGAGILLISEDLEEVLALSDRVAVMYEGEIMGILPIEEAKANVDTIGLMMAGSREVEA